MSINIGTTNRIERAFAVLEAAAVAGARCPVTSGPDASKSLRGADIHALAHAGRILIEISGRNWRQVTILTGPNAGKRTAPNPDSTAFVYQTVDTKGASNRSRPPTPGKPSPPRMLSREELR